MWTLDIDDDGNVADAPSPDETPLRIIDCEQNSEQWSRERMGIPTASAFDKVISRGRADRPSETRRKYMLTLLGERLTGVLAENFDTPATDRGHHDEEFAAQDYAFRQNVKIETIGFMRRGNVGVSPDRRIVGVSGLVEIKSKKPDLQLAVLFDDALPAEHKPQVQGALMVSGYDFVDFVSYCRDLPLFVKRIYRDEPYIDWLRDQVDQFNRELDALELHMLDRYYGGAR
ncbi:lambda exonuclease family protein [Salinisphaera hydrothermalis]|uniref:Exonuclease, phage-type n=1 Tax=Salinisphaera hydrothermalis (strain C41B8) TaxID=1304275 RepID=A0A084INS0_SALHC|nr:lambda exonuclease family protein [Salinisphaera hydrothermalis]KEZ78354.1 exonuclease, phage-type [Salinisphaera hydrothermalis C41B8]